MTSTNTRLGTMLAALLLLFSQACKKDKEARVNLPYFDQVVIMDNIYVEVMPGGEQRVVVTEPENLSSISFSTNKHTLTISGVGGNNIVRITQPDLRSISVRNNAAALIFGPYGSSVTHLQVDGRDKGIILAEEALSVDTLSVTLANSSIAAVNNLNADRLGLNLRDATRCNVEGSARIQQIDMNGSCRFNLDFAPVGDDVESPVRGDSVTISVDNGAHGWVNAAIYLNATGANDGRVFYTGQPVRIDSSMISGAQLLPRDN